MNIRTKMICLSASAMFIPGFIMAQSGLAGDIQSLQAVLDSIYDQMIPLCSSLIGVGRGIAGLAATWYIAYRVWGHIARAEPIDFYPLFRPFLIGLAVLMFPSVISLMNGILQPTVSATNEMVQGTNQAISLLLQQKQQAVQNSALFQMYVGPDGNGDRDKWYQYTHPDDPTGSGEGLLSSIGNDIKFAMAKMSYNFRNSVKEWMSEVLELLYEAAALCINTIRTFHLIVLAILGPLVFGLSVFDGLHHTLSAWIARYINIFLWLPVANLFGSILGKIEQNMIQLDINQIQSGGDTYFSSTDAGYLIFLVIGIIGYFTIPSVANYIVDAGSGNALVQKVSAVFGSSAQTLVSTGTAASVATTGALGTGVAIMAEGISSQEDHGTGSGGASGPKGTSNSYLAGRIKGES